MICEQLSVMKDRKVGAVDVAYSTGEGGEGIVEVDYVVGGCHWDGWCCCGQFEDLKMMKKTKLGEVMGMDRGVKKPRKLELLHTLERHAEADISEIAAISVHQIRR